MKKLTLTLLALGLIVAACSTPEGASGTTKALSVPTTPTVVTTTEVEPTTSAAVLSAEEIVAVELASDVGRIEELFHDYSDEWFVSLEAATTYIAEHVYAPLDCTPKSALATFGGMEGQRESIVVLGDTIERADGWIMPIGPSAGDLIEGRIYSFITETTVSVPGHDDVVSRDAAHATVSDGTAHFFFQCWDSVQDS
jgi:hypothetical protein